MLAMGLTVLKTPMRCPQANAFCERLIGTMRRECLDWLILFNARHLRCILHQWVHHYNRERPHASLGPAFLTYRSIGWCSRMVIRFLMVSA
jgi:transposase InsO family protein